MQPKQKINVSKMSLQKYPCKPSATCQRNLNIELDFKKDYHNFIIFWDYFAVRKIGRPSLSMTSFIVGYSSNKKKVMPSIIWWGIDQIISVFQEVVSSLSLYLETGAIYQPIKSLNTYITYEVKYENYNFRGNSRNT